MPSFCSNAEMGDVGFEETGGSAIVVSIDGERTRRQKQLSRGKEKLNRIGGRRAVPSHSWFSSHSLVTYYLKWEAGVTKVAGAT